MNCFRRVAILLSWAGIDVTWHAHEHVGFPVSKFGGRFMRSRYRRSRTQSLNSRHLLSVLIVVWIGPEVEGATACDPVACAAQSNACVSYSCTNGTCQGTPVNCNDGDPCTRDTCCAQEGCYHVSIEEECARRNNACDTYHCVNGNCQ